MDWDTSPGGQNSKEAPSGSPGKSAKQANAPPAAAELTQFDDNIYSLIKYVNQERVTYYHDNTELDPEFINNIFRELGNLRGAVATMTSYFSRDPCPEFMYFVNLFESISRDFIEDLVNVSEKEPLTLSEIRTTLSRLQLTYIKILAIYEARRTNQFPTLVHVRDILEIHRFDVFGLLSVKIEEYENRKKIYFQKEEGFKTELAILLNILHLKLIKILFAYYTIYAESTLSPPPKKYITETIARALYFTSEIQKKLEGATETIKMTPLELLHQLQPLYNELEVFLTFTTNYVEDRKHPNLASSADRLGHFFDDNQGGQPPVKGVVTLFTHRKCTVCQRLYESPLWPFIQHLACDLHLQIKLIETHILENDALCKGIYDIIAVPTLKYQDRLYWINPATESGSGDPHATVKRELLNFFGVLGVYNIIRSNPQEAGKGVHHLEDSKSDNER